MLLLVVLVLARAAGPVLDNEGVGGIMEGMDIDIKASTVSFNGQTPTPNSIGFTCVSSSKGGVCAL